MTLHTDAVTCSAVVAGPRVALTARHCVEDGNRGIVVPHVGTAVGIEGVILDPYRDLAIVRVDGELPGPYADIREGVRVGESVIIHGGCKPSPKVARVVAAMWDNAVATGTPHVCPGDSGGGWFDREGRLVGITSRFGPDGTGASQSEAMTLKGVREMIADED